MTKLSNCRRRASLPPLVGVGDLRWSDDTSRDPGKSVTCRDEGTGSPTSRDNDRRRVPR